MLTWDASYELVLALKEAHPNTIVEEIGLQDLYTMIVALPDFVDDPSLVNDGILLDILREWYEESSS